MAAATPTMAAIVSAVDRRTAEIVDALRTLDAVELTSASLLPDWSLLTIACHLRYGAAALTRMTADALEGRTTLLLPRRPGGRAARHPRTRTRRNPRVRRDVAGRPERRARRAVERTEDGEWARTVHEPPDNVDLGPVELGRLPLLRLTEVEVHGSDLGLGLRDWSDVFVRAALPMRIAWLNARRANHRAFDADLEGSWLLAASDGPAYAVAVRGTAVRAGRAESSPAHVATATIEGTSRDLLALLARTATPRGSCACGATTGSASGSRDAFPGP